MKVSIALLVLTLISCATTTSLVSVRDKSYRGGTIDTIAVSTPYDDLELKSAIESAAATALESRVVKCYRMIDILPPIRSYSPEEMDSTFKSLNLQAVLVFAIKDYWVDELTIGKKTVTTSEPEKTVTTERTHSSGSISYWSNWASFSGVSLRESVTASSGGKKTTYHDPGTTLTKTNVRLDARLFVFDTNGAPLMLWRANSTTSGNYFTPGSDVMSAAIREVRNTLWKDSILTEPPDSEEHREFRNFRNP